MITIQNVGVSQHNSHASHSHHSVANVSPDATEHDLDDLDDEFVRHPWPLLLWGHSFPTDKFVTVKWLYYVNAHIIYMLVGSCAVSSMSPFDYRDCVFSKVRRQPLPVFLVDLQNFDGRATKNE